MTTDPRAALRAALTAVLLCLPAAAPAARKPAAAPPAHLGPLFRLVPELAAQAGVESALGHLDHLDDATRAKVLKAFDQAIAAQQGGSPDAALLRARLTREKAAWDELDARERMPSRWYPAVALVEALTAPGATFAQQLEWAAGRMQEAPLRFGEALKHCHHASKYMVLAALRDGDNCLRVVDRIRELCDTLPEAEGVRERMDLGAVGTSTGVRRFGDYLLHELKPSAPAEARPDTADFDRLMRRGYGMTDSPVRLEAELAAAVAEAHSEMDSLAVALHPGRPAGEILQALKGSHPMAEELLASVESIHRSAEGFAKSRWPDLPFEPVEVRPMGFGWRVEGVASTLVRPQPLRAAAQSPAVEVALTDPSFPPDVQEAFLEQSNFYFDTLLAARNDAPGEALLWNLHRSDPPARLWAAGLGPFTAWGMFAQHLAARSGQFSSLETRLFEAWTRLIMLAQGLEDVRLGRHVFTPQEAPGDLSNLTGVDRRQCEGYVQTLLESPGREAAQALQYLSLEREWKRLRGAGAPEGQALRELAKVALYPPSTQEHLVAARH